MTDTPLYQHQRDAAAFAEAVGGNCAMFHEPGLGKTRTSLEIFRQRRVRNPQLRLLVVCPLSLVNAAWGEDIKRFTDFTFVPFKQMGAAVPDIVIINYEALISKKHLPALKRMVAAQPFMCVLDESSRLKSNKSITTKTLLELAPLFKYRIVASGTPMPNSELELWGQINFLRPEYLCKSFYAFRNTYFHLERNGQKMRLSGQYISREYMREILSSGWRYAITGENRQRLMDKIRPLANWVKKEDALDLPEKVDEIREVELSAEEWSAYEDMRKYLVAEINGTEITAQVALAKLMKLRQATSGFFYAADGKVVETGKSSKLRELENVVEELGNQPVIIWVQFHQEVEAVQKMLAAKYGAEQVVTLYSETPDRDESIWRFKTGQARYLVAHPKSAGHGLTFVNCSVMVFYSLDYSYETHTQARDRIHRIGQNHSCLYIYLLANDTIDGHLLKVLQKKQSLQEAVHALVRNKA